jgi:aldehyde:ferredoxin oxidoreductase
MGGHWGPELKYAGFDGIIVQGESPRPVWLKIEDDKVTLEDASQIWGQGIYRATNYICNLMGSEAHVAAIGQIGEAKVRMAAVYCDRSHRAGGVGGVMGAKRLKAIGVKGTGAVHVAANKASWKALNKYYLSLMGANNQCVVARELQPWSEFSPGGTRWSGKKGLLWGAASPPVDLGTCPDVEYQGDDAPNPYNKIGLRTHKGFNDFGEEGQKRTVRMDGCHACPIRCHIAADHPELEQYGVSRYNMNTCIGNSGLRTTITNSAGSNPAQNPMMLAYMSNHLEGDYGMWSDYQGYVYAFNYAYSHVIAADAHNPAEIPDPANPGQMIPNPDIGRTILQKYLPAA